MSPLLGIALIALQDGLPTAPVTFETRATLLGRALEGLSTKAGVTLSTTPDLAREVVVIEVTNQPLNETLARIATATAGRWEPLAGGWRLVPDNNLRLTEARTERAARAESIRKQIAARLAPPKEKPGEKKRTINFGAMSGDGVVDRLLARISADLLAGIDDNGRIVFASSPTRTQRPLPTGWDGIVGAYVKTHNERATATKESDVDGTLQKANMPDFIRDMVAKRMRPIERPSKVMLAIGEGAWMLGGVTATLSLFGADGSSVATETVTLGTSIMEDLVEAAGGKKPTATAGKTSPLPLSDDTKAFEKATGAGAATMGFGPEALNPIPAAVRAKLLRPDLHDPLSFRATDMVRHYAKREKRPLVAVLPDAMDKFAGFGGQADTIEAVAAGIDAKEDLQRVADPAFVVLRPSQPAFSRGHRADRFALARLIAAAQAKGTAGLDDVAAYAATEESPLETIARNYVSTVAPGSFSGGMDGMPDWRLLRFWGRLGDGARRKIEGGGVVTLPELDPNARAALAERLFAGDASFVRENAPAAEERPFWMTMMDRSGKLDQEPTEVMPNGLLPATRLTSVSKNDISFGMRRSDGSVVGLMGVAELGMMRFFSEDKNFAPMVGSFMPKLDDLSQGRRRIIDLRILVAPGVYASGKLTDDALPAGSPIVKFSRLPADLEARVAKEADKIRKSPMGALGAFMGSQGGQGIRP